VGTEIDELPLLAGGWHEPLQPGMVFALEPKYIHPTLGIVGIENTWLVTETGVERLTPDDDGVIEV
jgi:Xaa-Pro dipeptidase